MKETIQILMNFRVEEWPNAKKFFLGINRVDLAHAPQEKFGYRFEFDALDENYILFLRKTKEYNFDYVDYHYYKYSKEELVNSKLLLLNFDKNPKGRAGSSTGNEYDFKNACPKCGTGAVQKSQLLVRPSDLPKNRDISQMITGEYLVSENLKKKIDKFNLKLNLNPVIASTTKKKLNWYQLYPNYIMPPASKTSKHFSHSISEKSGCSFCNRDGWGRYKYPIELHYDDFNESFLEKSDAFFTYEQYSYTRIKEPFKNSFLSWPFLLVSSKLVEILYYYNELKFDPVVVNGVPNIKKWRKESGLLT